MTLTDWLKALFLFGCFTLMVANLVKSRFSYGNEADQATCMAIFFAMSFFIGMALCAL